LRVDTLPSTVAANGMPAQLYLDSATSNYDAVHESFLRARVTTNVPNNPPIMLTQRHTDNTSSATCDKGYTYDDDEDPYEEVHSPPNSPVSMIV
jgi:hypothetical protein